MKKMALDKLGCENETIDISELNGEIKKAKLMYFAKASLTSDILLSKLCMAKNYIEKAYRDILEFYDTKTQVKSYSEIYREFI